MDILHDSRLISARKEITIIIFFFFLLAEIQSHDIPNSHASPRYLGDISHFLRKALILPFEFPVANFTGENVRCARTRAQKRPRRLARRAVSPGFRMNKHCLNRDSGSPGNALPPPAVPPAPSFHGRSEIRDFTSAYYTLAAHRRDGCVEPFRRSSYLSTFVTCSASWIDLNLSPVRDGSFTSFFFFSLLSLSPTVLEEAR